MIAQFSSICLFFSSCPHLLWLGKLWAMIPSFSCFTSVSTGWAISYNLCLRTNHPWYSEAWTVLTALQLWFQWWGFWSRMWWSPKMISIGLHSWVGWHGIWVHFYCLDTLECPHGWPDVTPFLGILPATTLPCHLCCNPSVVDIRLAGFTHVPSAVIFILSCLKLMDMGQLLSRLLSCSSTLSWPDQDPGNNDRSMAYLTVPGCCLIIPAVSPLLSFCSFFLNHSLGCHWASPFLSQYSLVYEHIFGCHVAFPCSYSITTLSSVCIVVGPIGSSRACLTLFLVIMPQSWAVLFAKVDHILFDLFLAFQLFSYLTNRFIWINGQGTCNTFQCTICDHRLSLCVGHIIILSG